MDGWFQCQPVSTLLACIQMDLCIFQYPPISLLMTGLAAALDYRPGHIIELSHLLLEEYRSVMPMRRLASIS